MTAQKLQILQLAEFNVKTFLGNMKQIDWEKRFLLKIFRHVNLSHFIIEQTRLCIWFKGVFSQFTLIDE